MSGLPWFRVYAAARHNPKVQRLPDAMFKPWFNLMCLGCERDGYLPSIEDIAFELRMSERKAEATVADLIARRLIDETLDGRLRMHDWSEHQFRSDVSTARVKRFRERHAKQDETVSETPPEQSRADTEQNRVSVASATAASAAIVPLTPLDLKKQLWATGRGFLGSHGISEERAGSLIGKWLKALGGGSEAQTALLTILASAEAHCVGNVIEYIEGAIERHKHGRVDNGEDRSGFGAAIAAARAVAAGG